MIDKGKPIRRRGVTVILPPHGSLIEVSCELAAVIGSRHIGRVAPDEIAEYIEGFTIMVGLRDTGLLAELEAPTERETFFAGTMARWYDGSSATWQPIPT